MDHRKLQKLFAPVLYPISLGYGLVVAVRNKLFDWNVLKSEKFDLPVIAVGNITVGGTGKTPHVEYLLNLLSSNLKLGFLSRGYKRTTKGFVLASESASPALIGDEPYQVYQKFGKKVAIAVDENRVRGVRELIKKNLQAVILDDAYQHRYIKPGVSIVLIDYHRPLQKDHLIPFGELRENKGGLKRANIVIVTKVPKSIKPIEKRILMNELNLFPYQYLFFTRFEYGELIPVFASATDEFNLAQIKKRQMSVLLVSGIANPSPLAEEIQKYTANISKLLFADHVVYGQRHVKEIASKFGLLKAEFKIIITTEKDAVKLRELDLDAGLKKSMYYLPVLISFQDNGEKEFNKIIREFAERNKPVNRLHK